MVEMTGKELRTLVLRELPEGYLEANTHRYTGGAFKRFARMTKSFVTRRCFSMRFF